MARLAVVAIEIATARSKRSSPGAVDAVQFATAIVLRNALRSSSLARLANRTNVAASIAAAIVTVSTTTEELAALKNKKN